MTEYSPHGVKLFFGGVEVKSFTDASHILPELSKEAEGELDKLRGNHAEVIALDFEGLEFHVLALQAAGKLPPGLYQAVMFGSPKPRQVTAREIKKNNWHTPFHPSVIKTDVTGSHEPWKRNNRLVGKRSRKSK